ncbi:hypothetical protein GUITHDRAFT_116071 [Guillardia theta CCMP2712]|uniref:Thioredoxin domain-containing protein n=1 Tax=Guillardia theta (strain CCMP2712) TaxID=905079 RepID=L1IPH2_GUITC|nr:hypothetical protein GUITHDRAFT_116071 [Guillardia theta CCMP2712]EKX37764.1 hypothetical protein GUITHDRAFT_116071 [Guillardia theta CCMP2712]|eukprot:XP_005824744.1 hypothetical protein GUITHDRAFT_116071 [Guillardia theta CCMP2712]
MNAMAGAHCWYAETRIGQGYGKADIGGPFVLLDQNGKTRSDMDFRGKHMFMYFGFTYCPDICPNEMMRMKQILSLLDKMHVSDKIVPIFITIDPERDGPLQLKEYLSDWDSRIVGLTGTPDQIKDVCQKYRVYHSKSTLGNNPGDYLIDHSILFYMLDPQGNFVDYFGKSLSIEEIAMKIFKYVSGALTRVCSPNSVASKSIDHLLPPLKEE